MKQLRKYFNTQEYWTYQNLFGLNVDGASVNAVLHYSEHKGVLSRAMYSKTMKAFGTRWIDHN